MTSSTSSHLAATYGHHYLSAAVEILTKEAGSKASVTWERGEPVVILTALNRIEDIRSCFNSFTQGIFGVEVRKVELLKSSFYIENRFGVRLKLVDDLSRQTITGNNLVQLSNRFVNSLDFVKDHLPLEQERKEDLTATYRLLVSRIQEEDWADALWQEINEGKGAFEMRVNVVLPQLVECCKTHQPPDVAIGIIHRIVTKLLEPEAERWVGESFLARVAEQLEPVASWLPIAAACSLLKKKTKQATLLSNKYNSFILYAPP